jgi:hypothetical protein
VGSQRQAPAALHPGERDLVPTAQEAESLRHSWCQQISTIINSIRQVPSNVIRLVFGSSCLMNGKKHILLENVCSLPYSLCH